MAKYVTQSEAARRLGVHPNTIGTMLRDGRLEAVIVGNGSGPNQGMRRVDERSLILAEAKRALGSPTKTVDELLREERVKVLTELADELDAMRDNAPSGFTRYERAAWKVGVKESAQYCREQAAEEENDA